MPRRSPNHFINAPAFFNPILRALDDSRPDWNRELKISACHFDAGRLIAVVMTWVTGGTDETKQSIHQLARHQMEGQ